MRAGLTCAVLSACLAIAESWSVLLLGGSGFKGHLTSELLLKEGHEVTILSRGRKYWGILPKLMEKGAKHWECNRTVVWNSVTGSQPDSGLGGCPHLVNGTGSFFDAVVDFSSRTPDELRQAVGLLKGRVGIYIFISNHGIYDVVKNATHGEDLLFESDAVRPGREVSPLERYALKGKNPKGNDFLECEEELLKQYNAGGFPYAVLRLANSFGPRENSMRYWLLHLWVRSHISLRIPMHLDNTMLETPISMTYMPDVAQAVYRVIEKSRGDACCPEDVHGQAFNLVCEEAPNQRRLYNYVAEPMGLSYVETIEMDTNKSIVLYPEIVRGPLSSQKALDKLRWTPTDLTKAVRSVARFYDRVMMDETKHKYEREAMYQKCRRMLGEDGSRFVSYIQGYYADRRKTELYDELDDEDEDEIVLARPAPEKRRQQRARRRRRGGAKSTEL